MRIAVYLRAKSPLYSSAYDEVIKIKCAALNVPYDRSRLLAIQKWTKLIAMVFDIFYDDYDTSTAHHKANLPVLHVTHGRASNARVASPQFREFINCHIAQIHWPTYLARSFPTAMPQYPEQQNGNSARPPLWPPAWPLLQINQQYNCPPSSMEMQLAQCYTHKMARWACAHTQGSWSCFFQRQLSCCQLQEQNRCSA
jgi:hypothetical protein